MPAREKKSLGSGEFAPRRPRLLPSRRQPPPTISTGFRTDEKLTSRSGHHALQQFLRVLTDKEGVADEAAGFVRGRGRSRSMGWCSKPAVFDLDDLLKIAPPEERVYRMRCVEAWSMVIPWAGFSLSKLLERVEPLSSAKYVAFQTLLDPERMPNQTAGVLEWPYVEGLRMDEAMHPLTILAAGIYGTRASAAGWRAGAAGRAVEVWIQGDQVDREDHAGGQAAAARRGTLPARASMAFTRT